MLCVNVGSSGGIPSYFGIQYPFYSKWGLHEMDVEEEWGI